jgi:hypothetical protein
MWRLELLVCQQALWSVAIPLPSVEHAPLNASQRLCPPLELKKVVLAAVESYLDLVASQLMSASILLAAVPPLFRGQRSSPQLEYSAAVDPS